MKLISMDTEMFEWHQTAVFDYGISNYSPNYTHSESIQSLNRNFCRMFFYACQIGSKCQKIVFYIFKHNIYVRIAIYMSKLQYIRLQFTKYMSKSMYGVSFYIALL